MKLFTKLKDSPNTHVFLQCDACIGITPCKITNTGRIICEYCKTDLSNDRNTNATQIIPEHLNTN